MMVGVVQDMLQEPCSTSRSSHPTMPALFAAIVIINFDRKHHHKFSSLT
jgi:hypothetical protein